jgi:hypothetical protein
MRINLRHAYFILNASHLQNTKPPQLGPGALPRPLLASRGRYWFHPAQKAFSSTFIPCRTEEQTLDIKRPIAIDSTWQSRKLSS